MVVLTGACLLMSNILLPLPSFRDEVDLPCSCVILVVNFSSDFTISAVKSKMRYLIQFQFTFNVKQANSTAEFNFQTFGNFHRT